MNKSTVIAAITIVVITGCSSGDPTDGDNGSPRADQEKSSPMEATAARTPRVTPQSARATRTPEAITAELEIVSLDCVVHFPSIQVSGTVRNIGNRPLVGLEADVLLLMSENQVFFPDYEPDPTHTVVQPSTLEANQEGIFEFPLIRDVLGARVIIESCLVNFEECTDVCRDVEARKAR